MFCLSLCGCSGEEIVEYDNVENVSADFRADFEKCKTKSYDNLDFSECNLLLYEFENLKNLNITVENETASISELAKEFEEYCRFFFGSYNSDCALFDSPEYPGLGIVIGPDGKEYRGLPKIIEHQERFEENNNDENSIDVNFLMYRDIENDNYLWWHCSQIFPHWVNKGEAFSLEKSEGGKVSSWIPSDLDEKVASYYDDGNSDNKTYRLLGGDVSIGEAVSFLEDSYLDSLPYEFDDNYSLNVYRTDVYNVKDDVYAYVLYFSTAWKGMSFDNSEERVTFEDASHHYSVSGQALMVKKNDIDAFVNMNFPTITEENFVSDRICTLESAVDIVSAELTKEVVFDVKTIELVYRGSYNEEFTTAYTEPYWKFLTYNSNDARYYTVYVRLVDGTSSYDSFVPIKEY